MIIYSIYSFKIVENYRVIKFYKIGYILCQKASTLLAFSKSKSGFVLINAPR